MNLTACSFQKLQRVLNATAHIVSLRPKHEDITLGLISLHWLPIEHRIHYKVILFVFRCLHNVAPFYLNELLKLYAPEHNLQSLDKIFLDYNTPSTKHHQLNMVNVLFQCPDQFCGTVWLMITDCWRILVVLNPT